MRVKTNNDKTYGVLELLFLTGTDASPTNKNQMPNKILFILWASSKRQNIFYLSTHLQDAKDVSVGGADEIVKEIIGKASHYVDYKTRLKVKLFGFRSKQYMTQ